MSVFEMTAAEVMVHAAERRLDTVHRALDELRQAFPTTFVLTTTTPAPEPLPAHLRPYAAEVDRWRLEALAVRATRPYEGR